MNKEKRELIEATIKDLKQLDRESLLIVKSGAEMLRARDALEPKKKDTEERQPVAV